jgi:peptidoglycan/xylan/chitin deacetylase (PgdA/CDA1 family)
VLIVAVVVIAAVVLAVVRPWSGLHLPWSGSSGGSASASTASSSDGALTIVGADDLWHSGPADLRFRDADGKPVAASYRIDGGEWQQGKRVHVRGPADHGNDGMHTVEAKPLDGGDTASVKVGIDTTPPEVTAAKVAPDRTDGAGTLKLSFSAPAEDGVTVEWAVVDVLDKPVGEQGKPAAPAGAVSVDWTIPTVDGEKLGPGTYFLSVRATDKAGNVTEERASLACIHPVKARIITSLPKAGKEVALTFDGGSGYAWRSQMNELYSHDQLGTFFCTGVSVDRYPDMAKLAVEQHQTLGNHSYDHPDFSSISYEEQVSQLERNSDAWWKACQAVPQPFFRPPYGSQTATTVKAAGDAGYRYVVMWNGDAGDWRGLSASQVAANALAAAKPGAIIVFHTQWNSDAALPAILKGLKAKGLKAVSLAQLCADAGLPY